MHRLAFAALVGALAANAWAAPPAVARGSVLASQSDACPSPADMVVDYDPVAPNRLSMRVQHIGDPGTVELSQQVRNGVSWNVGEVTGFAALAQDQRGFRDDGLPIGSSAFQLACDGAGFFINTWEFSHRSVLVGEGPNAGLGADLVPGFPFGDGIVLSVDATLPYMRTQTTPVTEGTAQLGFVYYMHDRRSGHVFAQTIALYDNRPFGLDGVGGEFVGSDGFTAFASSPLRATAASGEGVRFVSPPTRAEMQTVDTWTEPLHFQAVITAANLRAVLAAVAATDPVISRDPTDYVVTSYGIGIEVIPGTGDAHNVAIGAGVRNFTLSSYRAGRVRGGR